MLENRTLQFTQVKELNDPFDCHPGLIDFSCHPEYTRALNMSDVKESVNDGKITLGAFRQLAYVCSLSKNNDSVSMWSHYANNHRGVCIELHLESLGSHGIICGQSYDVSYDDIIRKPNYFTFNDNINDPAHYMLTTKAREWEREQEVRYITQGRPKIRPNDTIDNDERYYRPQIPNDCFAAIYLGVNIDKDVEKEIIESAKKLNADVKIYKMQVDPNALRLIPIQK